MNRLKDYVQITVNPKYLLYLHERQTDVSFSCHNSLFYNSVNRKQADWRACFYLCHALLL